VLENRQSLTGNVPGEERTFVATVFHRDRFRAQIRLQRPEGWHYTQNPGSGWNRP
jgi:hypothetical protein